MTKTHANQLARRLYREGWLWVTMFRCERHRFRIEATDEHGRVWQFGY